jgi:hypothetical protein
LASWISIRIQILPIHKRFKDNFRKLERKFLKKIKINDLLQVPVPFDNIFLSVTRKIFQAGSRSLKNSPPGSGSVIQD